MPSGITNLFNFGRLLPEPFTSTSKKVSVSSKYGDKTSSTLCATVIKAVHAFIDCMEGNSKGAVGLTGDFCVGEYKSSTGPEDYHLVVYNKGSGSIKAGVYNRSTEIMEEYAASARARDGAAILFTMMPELLSDEEFQSHFDKYKAERDDGYPEMEEAILSMAILCDNAYRRIKDASCVAHIKADVNASGVMDRLSKMQLDKGEYEPRIVSAGEFQIFAKTAAAGPIKSAKLVIENKDFEGKYPLSSRSLTPYEKSLIPELPSWYIIPQEVVDICKHASATTGKSAPMRNFLLRGPAGTGKTMGAKAIAAGLGLPYMKYTCSADTEVYDFIGQVFPETEYSSAGDADLALERETLKAQGGINYKNVAELMKLPDLDDMEYDPEGVYRAMTGAEKKGVSVKECMELVLEKVTEKVRQLSKTSEQPQGGGQRFSYVETDFLRALKNGYVVEIQEPTTIVQPGVLVGLNSLLEQEGTITLPTGEVIRRHPDAVVVVTTNVSYEGCRGMNQSIIDRMNLVRDVELPEPEVMVQRAMSVTGAADEYEVSEMVKVVDSMAKYCRTRGISDGNVGMRSLIDWIMSSMVTENPYESALYTIISKATSDENDRYALIENVLEPVFSATRYKKAI